MKKKILFVYNADSGLFNTLTDIAHKVFSPQSYQCNLCAITYGNFAIRAEWKEFLDTLDAELEFLHRDEFIKKHAHSEMALPAVFLKEGEKLELWITAEDINRCRSIEDIKLVIIARMKT